MTLKQAQIKDSKNLFSENYSKLVEKGFSAIPDKYMGKTPLIKDWTDYCHRLPSSAELESWSNRFPESNIALCMGKESGIVALDIDEDRQEILDIIMPILPDSPVKKVGAKGETRFFRFAGDHTDALKFNGKMCVEILSTGKKTTIPPSVHPNGASYKWVGKSLIDINKEELPILPPALLAHLGSVLRSNFKDLDSSSSSGNFTYESGRNNNLGSLCGKLINERVPVDEALKALIQFDNETHTPPLFSDPEENRHTEIYTNALRFYTNHLQSVNTRRYLESKEYEVPITASAVSQALGEKAMEGKLIRLESQKRSSKVELPHAKGVLGTLQQNILANSWVKQEAFAFSASLILLGTLISRKLVFQGISSNLYVLNVAPSGSGKDAPQQMLKKYLTDINRTDILGAGDYVSDASLMDSLPEKPVRLDIMDEAGGILKSVTTGETTYGGKMADILAELYTSSNSRYLGRATADGTKGSCYRPNVSILASTTPAGLSEGISLKAIEKGLMGRFLVFLGDYDKGAERLREFPKLDDTVQTVLKYWAGYKPRENHDYLIADIPQMVEEVKATSDAESLLDTVFMEFDGLRRKTDSESPLMPIIARLYQQMVKVTMIHAVSRSGISTPVITPVDVEFGRDTVLYYFETIKAVVDKYIFGNSNERDIVKVLEIIRSTGTVSASDLNKKTRALGKRRREDVIKELIDSEQIVADTVMTNNKQVRVYRSV